MCIRDRCFASSEKNHWKKSRTHQIMPQCQMMQQSVPITSNLSLIHIYLFRSMNLAQAGLNLDTDDLKQAGTLGLWTAVPKFDAARGMKFLT